MIEYKTLKTHLLTDLQVLEKLEAQIFEDFFTPLRLTQEADQKKGLLSHIAYDGDQPIAFKMGYLLKNDTFYSWLGGVLPTYRKKGIGQKLTQLQHQSVHDMGLSKIRTTCRNRFPEMLIHNIKNGFKIIGVTYQADEKDISITFEKTL